MVTGIQLRMARAALRLKIDDVAEQLEIPWARLQRMERQDDSLSIDPDALSRLEAFFDARGVCFTSGNGSLLPGVALRGEWATAAPASGEPS